RIDRLPTLTRHEGMLGGNEVAALVERVELPRPQERALDPDHAVDLSFRPQDRIAHADLLDGLHRAVGHRNAGARDKAAAAGEVAIGARTTDPLFILDALLAEADALTKGAAGVLRI